MNIKYKLTDKILVKIPYPSKFLGINFSIKKKIGFLFTNLAVVLFRNAHNIEDSDAYKKWVEKNGSNKLLNEILYYSAVAFSMDERKKENFTKEKLAIAFILTDKETQEQILSCWKNSCFYKKGAKKKKTSKK